MIPRSLFLLFVRLLRHVHAHVPSLPTATRICKLYGTVALINGCNLIRQPARGMYSIHSYVDQVHRLDTDRLSMALCRSVVRVVKLVVKNTKYPRNSLYTARTEQAAHTLCAVYRVRMYMSTHAHAATTPMQIAVVPSKNKRGRNRKDHPSIHPSIHLAFFSFESGSQGPGALEPTHFFSSPPPLFFWACPAAIRQTWHDTTCRGRKERWRWWRGPKFLVQDYLGD